MFYLSPSSCADSIQYSDDIEEALYRMPVQGFVAKMEKAAGECMHVLQKGHMLPLFWE